MQTKLIKYIEGKYPGYTARPGLEHQAYALETRVAGLTDDDLKQLRAQQLVLAKITEETAPQNKDTSQQEKNLIEFMQKKDEVIKETAEIIAARNNPSNTLAFILANCQIFFKEQLFLDTPYKFNLTKEANSLVIHYKERKCSLIHKLTELLLQQIFLGEHYFIFYLNDEKEIGLCVDGVIIQSNAPTTPLQP
ncbi:MAG: hypothetical protein LBK68_07730 [Candidatus Margulisbacteria bacterium]|jgi:hypothetical protein|nr:hypothetical protein [Candidatus Margulisiibacteriota bacterium]